MVIVMFFGMAFLSVPSQAKTVSPSGKKDATDTKNILKALKKTGKVTLKSGKKYYLASPLKVTNGGWTINATGAKITCAGAIIQKSTFSMKKSNYSDVKNITIKGGTWSFKNKTGFKGSSIRFAHASKLKFYNMTLKHTNYDGHCFEFIACRDVTMSNCKIYAMGTKCNSNECMVQLDIASKYTSGNLPSKLLNGATCKNIRITGCTITGNSGVASAWAKGDSQYSGNAHEDIVLENNTITGVNYEGVSLRNCLSARITGNTIVSMLGANDQNSAGLSCMLPGDVTGATMDITGNTIKGGAYAVLIKASYSPYEKVVLRNNDLCSKTSEYEHIYQIDEFDEADNTLIKP